MNLAKDPAGPLKAGPSHLCRVSLGRAHCSVKIIWHPTVLTDDDIFVQAPHGWEGIRELGRAEVQRQQPLN